MDISLFQAPDCEKRTICAVCRHPLPDPLIELPSLPLTDILVREPVQEAVGFVDQTFHLCKECGHGQLGTLISPKVLYGSAYSLRTSGSRGARGANDRFLQFIRGITGRRDFEAIVEIGSNDLYLLSQLRSWLEMPHQGHRLIGIDPLLEGREAEFPNFRVIGQFFEDADIDSLHNTLVVTSHVLEHLRDPRAFLERLLEKADETTLFAFQFPTLEPLVRNLRFDQIYHHHLHYFSRASFTYLLNRLGCEIVGTQTDTQYWGALMVAFRKGGQEVVQLIPAEDIPAEDIEEAYLIFSDRMNSITSTLEWVLAGAARVVAYGASLQLPVLDYHLHHAMIYIESVIDDDEGKWGMYYLYLPQPIKGPKEISQRQWPDMIVLITAIGFSRGILQKLIPLNPRRIITPLDI
ncbi:MAG: class I SAM-dependent methyltransferase [Patescibacteria group bacterium]